MQTCKHFRNQVPQDLADELRDADTEPCPVCDALPHRRWLAENSVPKFASRAKAFQVMATAGWQPKRGWLAHWLGHLHPAGG